MDMFWYVRREAAMGCPWWEVVLQSTIGRSGQCERLWSAGQGCVGALRRLRSQLNSTAKVLLMSDVIVCE